MTQTSASAPPTATLTGGPAAGPTPVAAWRRPLYRSGYALVLSSGLTSAVGFVFWIVAAREYSPDVVGKNSALVYAIMFLAGVAQLNLTNVLVRFVPVAGRRSRRLVGLAYAVGGGFAVLAGLVFAWGARLWSPDLAEVFDGRSATLLFAASTGIWAIFVMQDGVLTATGRAAVVPLENAVFSCLKVAMVVVLAAVLPLRGIAVSWMAATAMAVVATNGYLFARALPAHVATGAQVAEPLPVRRVARYAGGDYLGVLCWLGCTQLLPVLVLGRVGPAGTAVFSMAWTIAYSLYLVPSGLGQSLVAHTAADPAELESARRGVVRHALALLVPVVAVLFVAAPYVLALFGRQYAESGTWVLRLAVLSSLPNVVTASAVSAARVRRRMSVVVALLGTLSGLVLALTLLLIPHLGITGVGVALLAGQALVAAGLLVGTAEWLPRPIVGPTVTLRNAALLRRTAPAALRTAGERRSSQAWRLQGRLAGRSECAVALVGPPDAPEAVLKAVASPCGRAQLRRQSEVLALLHADERLGPWRRLLPRILLSGETDLASFVLESRLTGLPAEQVLRDPSRRSRVVAAAQTAITELHHRSARLAVVDEAALRHWVRDPAQRVRAAAGRRFEPGLCLLVDTLATGLAGHLVPVGWTHGDYSPGNLLLDTTGVLAGVVDWGRAQPDGPAVLDIVILLLTTESQCGGRELGPVVREWAAGRDPAPLAALARAQRQLGGDAVDGRVLVLLAWLHLVASNLAQNPRYAAHPVWMRRNVRSVLAAMAAPGQGEGDARTAG